MEFVIITGMSGSGKSTAVNAMEDIGFFCIDNMPPKLIPGFIQLYKDAGPHINYSSDEPDELDDSRQKVAIVTDIRGGEMFLSLGDIINEIRANELNKAGENDSSVSVKVLFLDAPNDIIKRRYKETRRLHPLFYSENGDMARAVEAERNILSPIAEIADYRIDTGVLSTAKLKESVMNIFLNNISDSMLVKCTSFGFKYGIPQDADLVFDVRCLPNPFYIPELKGKTGLDKEVRDFVMKEQVSQDLEAKLFELIDFLVPCYIAEGKSQLVIAFGCTGGKHRSITFAERLGRRLEDKDYRVKTFHRDKEKN